MTNAGQKHYCDPYVGFFARTRRADAGPIVGGVRCLEWTGAKASRDYGAMRVGERSVGTHRYAYATFKGPIPDGMSVCHKCDNPICCEVAHLFLGTQSNNMRDMVSKGRDALTRARAARHGMSKLTSDQVASIRERYAAGGVTQVQMAQEFSVTQSLISKVVRAEHWKHVR